MLTLLLNVLLLIGASVVLVKSATTLVKAVSLISAHSRISEFTVAFIFMSIVTTLPETAVSINAALDHKSTLALGTALGSNLADLTLIIAIPVLIAGKIRIESIIARRDVLFMSLFALIPLLMIWDGTLSQTDAIVLLVFYGLYIYRLIKQSKRFPEFSNHVTRRETGRQVFLFVIATLLLIVSSRVIVWTAENTAQILHIPIILVGLVLVAVGTSLPELAFELRAITTHHDEQILGNILGSVVANSTLVLALAALINPIVVEDFSSLFTTTIFLVIVLILFSVGVFINKELTIREALVLLLIYVMFLVAEFGLEIIHKVSLNGSPS